MPKYISFPFPLTVLVSLCFCGCDGRANSPSPTSSNISSRPVNEGNSNRFPVENSGRAFLSSGDNERLGYGLYSYLLLPSRPEKGSRYEERCLLAIKLWQVKIEPVDDVEDVSDPERINITYLPVNNQKNWQAESAEALLENYDFATAQKLLSFLTDSDTSDLETVYLVSVRKPLSAGLTRPYLFIKVATTEKVAFEKWMEVFLDKVKHEERWNKTSLKEYALYLRQLLDQAGVLATEIFVNDPMD